MTRAASYMVRPAKTNDVDSVALLLDALQSHLEASNPDLWRKAPQARSRLPAQITSRLRSGESCALVAEHKSCGIVGVIFGRIITNNSYEPSRAGMIDQAYVLPAHRRAGVGSLLVTQLCQFFASSGIEDISLRYVVGNREASAFWSALGFSPRITISGARLRTIAQRLAPRPAASGPSPDAQDHGQRA